MGKKYKSIDADLFLLKTCRAKISFLKSHKICTFLRQVAPLDCCWNWLPRKVNGIVETRRSFTLFLEEDKRKVKEFQAVYHVKIKKRMSSSCPLHRPGCGGYGPQPGSFTCKYSPVKIQEPRSNPGHININETKILSILFYSCSVVIKCRLCTFCYSCTLTSYLCTY